MIGAQAPEIKLYKNGRPFIDFLGGLLRGLLDLSDALFYDRNRVAIVLMAFCFTGYDAKETNLPSHTICGQKWHDRLITVLPDVHLWVLIDALAHRYHLGLKTCVRETFFEMAWPCA